MLTVQQSTTKAFNVYFGVSGLTVTASLSKNGGAFNSVSPTITDRSNGYYSIAPIAAHRDTIGENAWLFSASGQPSLPRVEQVIAANIDAVAFGASTLDAAGVRTELATELGRIDAAISSRASQTSVDVKPTLAQIEASTVLPTKTDVQNAGLL